METIQYNLHSEDQCFTIEWEDFEKEEFQDTLFFEELDSFFREDFNNDLFDNENQEDSL